MILRISKMLVMMALPIVLLACGGGESGPKTKPSGMRFVLAPGQTLPSDIDTSKAGTLDFGETNFVGVEKGPVKYDLTNITEDSVTFIKTGLLGGRDDIFITASSCFETLAAKDSCSVTIALSPKEQNRSYKDDYSVEFYFGTDQSVTSEPVKLKLAARTFAGALDPVKDVPGLSVSGNYQELEFKGIILGTTSPAQVVNYFYYGEDTIVLNTKGSVMSASATEDAALNESDEEIETESTCGLMRYGDSCMVQLYYKPSIPSAELADKKIFSHLPVNVQVGGKVATSTIISKKHSILPDNSVLMKFAKSDDTDFPDNHTLPLVGTMAGTISATLTDLKLVRTDQKQDTVKNMFYRLESTSNAILIDRKECDLVLKNPNADNASLGNCTFGIDFSPAVEGKQVGYIVAVAGAERTYLRVEGTATPAGGKEIGTNAKTTATVGEVELKTGIDTISATKRIKVNYTGGTEPALPFSVGIDTVTADAGLFSYTTTCVENVALSVNNPSCNIDVTFRGGKVAGDTTGNVTFILAGGIPVSLTGTTVAETTSVSKETPVEGLTINVKSHVYPTTGLGLVSQTLRIELENTSAKAITGFGTTSTDLTTFAFSKTLSKVEKCDSTIGANKTCILGYTFNPRNTSEKTAYISIYDNTTALRDNEIIKVVGTGALFNEYLSFGVVDQGQTATLVASYTNDGDSSVAIGTVTAEPFTETWIATADVDNFAAIAETGTSRVDLSKTYFRQDNFSVLPDGSNSIESKSSECEGLTLEPGASCLIRLEFKPATADTHYRAYVTLQKGGDTGVLDRLHVIGSSKDNSTMYMHPLVDATGDVTTAPDALKPYQDNASTAWVSWDTQFSVIGKTAYAYTGQPTKNAGPDEWKGDTYLRRYDAARNKWVILNPTNDVESPLGSNTGTDTGGTQGKMVSHDGKLYFYGVSSPTGSGSFYTLHSYDPNFGTDGRWDKLADGPHKAVNVAMTANEGKLYIYGGRQTPASTEVVIYDIASNTWAKTVIKGSKPPARMSSAIAVVEISRLIGSDNVSVPYLLVHGGSGGRSMTDTLSDLWALELPYLKANATPGLPPTVTERTETWAWVQLQQDSNYVIDGNNEILRPSPRSKHVFDYYNGQLVVTANGVNEKSGGVPFTGNESNYFVLDPAKLFAKDSTCASDKAVCNAFKLLDKLDTKLLSIHSSAVLSGDLWFHNWNILGVYFTKNEVPAPGK